MPHLLWYTHVEENPVGAVAGPGLRRFRGLCRAAQGFRSAGGCTENYSGSAGAAQGFRSVSLPQTTPRPVQQQTALIRRPSLSAQQVELAQQSQGLPVIRSMPIDFGDC